jgi:hypothetical protein
MLFYINEEIGFENDGLDDFYNGECESDLTNKEKYRHDYWNYVNERSDEYCDCYDLM